MSVKSRRADAGADIIEYLLSSGMARNRSEAADIYKGLESTAVGYRNGVAATIAEAYKTTYTDGLSNIQFARYNKALKEYAERKGISVKEAKDQLFNKVKEIKDHYDINNLINYSRIENNTSEKNRLNDIYDTDYSNEDVSGDSKKDAYDQFNSYYRDIMDWNDPNTTAGRTYDTMLEQERNAALDQMALTDMSAQQANLQQAAVVKQIADQVRNERMARLRAGMSESQIAQQDMANMMANMQAINDNAAAMNQARLNARYAYNNASQTALDKYMNALQATGNIGTGMAAADTSNPIIMGTQYANLSKKNQKGTDHITRQQ